MSNLIIGLIGTILMVVLIFTGLPLSFSFIAAGVVGLIMMNGLELGLTFVSTIPFNSAASYTLAVMPLFILMGDIAVSGKLTTDAYTAARKWVGRLPGGLAVTSTVASALFGAICGSMPATCSVMSQMAWPEMKRYKYDPRVGLGSIAASAPLAILIPPSIPMILFGLMTETSVGSLFMAGWVPGIMLTVVLSCVTIIWAIKSPGIAGSTEKVNLKEKLQSLVGTLPILVLIIAIMYFIWGGITTANEAAGVGSICAIIIVIFKHRCNWKDILNTLKKSATVGGSLLFMMVGVQIYNVFMTVSGLPQALAAWISGLPIPPIGVIWMMILIYLILGCFMDIPAIQTLCIPLFYPIVVALGYDLIWFGIITVMCCGMGGITPPVGMNLFVIQGIFKEIPISTLIKGIIPYLVGTFVVLILIVFIPDLVLFLPNLMIG